MIRDKTAEKLALLYGDAQLYYGKHTIASPSPEIARDTHTAIRKCYEFILREEMQRRFPAINSSLDTMFQHVKFAG
jgi:hypothetical protein